MEQRIAGSHLYSPLNQVGWWHAPLAKLDDGESGVTCFTINSDSTVSVEYILDNITQSANHLNHEEYTQLMKKVYPHYWAFD